MRFFKKLLQANEQNTEINSLTYQFSVVIYINENTIVAFEQMHQAGQYEQIANTLATEIKKLENINIIPGPVRTNNSILDPNHIAVVLSVPELCKFKISGTKLQIISPDKLQIISYSISSKSKNMHTFGQSETLMTKKLGNEYFNDLPSYYQYPYNLQNTVLTARQIYEITDQLDKKTLPDLDITTQHDYTQ